MLDLLTWDKTRIDIRCPGYCGKGIPVSRILCQFSRTHISSGYGFGSVTELTEVPSTGMEVLYNSQKFQVVGKLMYLYPGYCGTGVQNV